MNSGKTIIKIDRQICVACLSCIDMCDYNALRLGDEAVVWLENLCTGCLVCCEVCQHKAISQVTA